MPNPVQDTVISFDRDILEFFATPNTTMLPGTSEVIQELAPQSMKACIHLGL